MTYEFDHVDLSNDKENQQIEFDDPLDDKDEKKEVVGWKHTKLPQNCNHMYNPSTFFFLGNV